MVREGPCPGAAAEGGQVMGNQPDTRKRPRSSASKAKSSGLRGLLYDVQVRQTVTRLLDTLEASGAVVILDRAKVAEGAYTALASSMAEHRSFHAAVSQIGSRKGPTASREQKLERLHAWLAVNLPRFPRQLDLCALVAYRALPGLGLSESTIRREISMYRTGRKREGS